MTECVFCKIVAGEIPSSKVYEDDGVFAFDDIQPLAPVHVVLVPKRHVPTIVDMDVEGPDRNLPAELFNAVREVARIKGIDETGFRTVINSNYDGGQVIFHLHVHVLGGRRLSDDLG
ncbi:MAG: histidine triad nucleotide-binding protein [Syntrophales bacterium]|jgi:histidine triad (HIT) family protein|nr:histidine triad nucleotide-binding protein [Syntrophales bacterium]MCK9527685.1 histidine triad nucleotide-binding protein [Syntrophales bacterium]MDX9921660.1 histidine triad nucleotide-binding protein [Syntrophales bacterium]